MKSSQPIEEFPYKPGAIRSLKLINFMCHASFEQSFGPKVNFVVGPNGSGKSALLSALVVALGGRATITSRAKRTDDFVMYGKTYAKVSVVLHNYERVMEKINAFKPDDYGKFIIVEKTIYKNDLSKLVLKNDKDKKVSERKQELDEMLEHFGILINNPICILNQEVSKTFLHSKKPEDKFDLFMKATNLEQIENDYSSAHISHKEWGECSKKKNVAFRLLDAEYNSCREKFAFLENRAKLNDIRENLNHELIWAFIRDNEVASDLSRQKVETIAMEVAQAEETIAKRQDKIGIFESDIQKMKTEIHNVNSLMEDARKKLMDNRSKELAVKTRHLEAKQKVEHSQRKIARYADDRSTLEKGIQDMRKQLRDQNNLDLDNEQRKLDIEKLERENLNLQAKERTIRQHNDQLNSSMTSTRTDLHSVNTRISDLKNKRAQNMALLNRLKNGQENSLRKYGDHFIEIRKQIDLAYEQKRFRRKPIGPLGYYVKLKSQDIAPALELHLSRNSHAFVCDNQHDMSVLNGIIRKLASSAVQFRPPPIITRSFGPRHNTSRYKAEHGQYKTFLDHLIIEEDVVFNALVDRTNLESVLFVPSYAEAENLMINPSLVPNNTRCAYTKDCSVMYPKSAEAGYKSFSNNPKRFCLFIENNNTQILQVKRDIESISLNLSNSEREAKDIEENLKAQRKLYEDNKEEIMRVIQDQRARELELLNLKSIITIEPQELSALETELEAIIKASDSETLAKARLDEAVESYQAELDDIIKDKQSYQDLLKTHEDKRQTIHKMVDDTKVSITNAQNHIKQNQLVIQIRSKDKISESEKLKLHLEELARSEQNTPTDRPRPERIRDTAIVKQELAKIDARLRVEEQEMRDPEELKLSLKKRMSEIDGLKNLKDSDMRIFDTTTNSLALRKEGFLRLRSLTIGSVSTTFSTVMRSMGMNGEMKIHLDDVIHRGEVLKRAKTLEMSDAKSLSGGERSFSTVAFVLALWHHCASPFKLMDEIDVFMDMVTRRVSYNALIRFAEGSEDAGQFIFFSPLELPKFENSSSFVRTYEMPAINMRSE